MKKRILSMVIVGVMATALVGCGGSSSTQETTTAAGEAKTEAEAKTEEAKTEAAASMEGEITVISREDGSGTRGAFIELFGVEEKNDAGEKVDNTVDYADITNSTQVMLTSVSGNTAAIGYVSLGALNDTVKALKIDGAEPTVDNIKSGSYKISRPFNIATKGEVDELTQDFIDYILSSEGQKVVEDNGYISSVEDAKAYEGSKPSGSISVAGSSSVSPVMEKLIESYKQVNPNATVELQQSDSTTGMNSAIEGVCNIGMASRELKDSEKEAGLTSTVIATDGIAVIANNDNPIDGLTKDQVKDIYTGVITDWSEVQ